MALLLKTVKNVMVAKLKQSFKRFRNNLTTVGNLTIKTLLTGFAAKEMYIRPKNRSVSFQKRQKYFGKKCAVFVRKGGLFATY